jgi:hypothetical protein
MERLCSRERAADMTMTYLELVGPLRLGSDKRNGESDGDDETVGEIHDMVSEHSIKQHDQGLLWIVMRWSSSTTKIL